MAFNATFNNISVISWLLDGYTCIYLAFAYFN